jgi:hypothetical protein
MRQTAEETQSRCNVKKCITMKLLTLLLLSICNCCGIALFDSLFTVHAQPHTSMHACAVRMVASINNAEPEMLTTPALSSDAGECAESANSASTGPSDATTTSQPIAPHQLSLEINSTSVPTSAISTPKQPNTSNTNGTSTPITEQPASTVSINAQSQHNANAINNTINLNESTSIAVSQPLTPNANSNQSSASSTPNHSPMNQLNQMKQFKPTNQFAQAFKSNSKHQTNQYINNNGKRPFSHNHHYHQQHNARHPMSRQHNHHYRNNSNNKMQYQHNSMPNQVRSAPHMMMPSQHNPTQMLAVAAAAQLLQQQQHAAQHAAAIQQHHHIQQQKQQMLATAAVMAAQQLMQQRQQQHQQHPQALAMAAAHQMTHQQHQQYQSPNHSAIAYNANANSSSFVAPHSAQQQTYMNHRPNKHHDITAPSNRYASQLAQAQQRSNGYAQAQELLMQSSLNAATASPAAASPAVLNQTQQPYAQTQSQRYGQSQLVPPPHAMRSDSPHQVNSNHMSQFPQISTSASSQIIVQSSFVSRKPLNIPLPPLPLAAIESSSQHQQSTSNVIIPPSAIHSSNKKSHESIASTTSSSNVDDDIDARAPRPSEVRTSEYNPLQITHR